MAQPASFIKYYQLFLEGKGKAEEAQMKERAAKKQSAPRRPVPHRR